MLSLQEQINKELAKAFETAGYDAAYGRAVVSNRPDLCEFQCNGAMAAKKAYGKAPREIASEVAAKLEGSSVLKNVKVEGPGFINFDLTEQMLAGFISEMAADDHLGYGTAKEPKTIIVDYGGPNVAKPLHIGHLRAAIIGESVKRIGRFVGNKMIGDVHLGDWGLQMGLIIASLSESNPGLPYFDESFEGEYPEEAPFTISELEQIYPEASARSKADEDFRQKALKATSELQDGRPGYRALWRHIMNVSVADLKANYEKLNVSFELWKGESDVQKYIPDMLEKMEKDGFAYEDQGALIIDVKEDSDTKEVPPCIVRKSDGAALYATTDLATLVERMKLYDPDKVIYVVDKRQGMHFEQVFRAARKTGIVKPETGLEFLGFGTMNGKDGKPFKTREGGVMRLETLIKEIEDQMYEKIAGNQSVKGENIRETARIVACSALKYADLSNQATKDYIFDPDKFTSFEGNTGPYILYTIVRINSILEKHGDTAGNGRAYAFRPAGSESEKTLQRICAQFSQAVDAAYEESAPHRICAYIYELANAFNHFYHETKILSEPDEQKKEGYIALLRLVRSILNAGIDMLGFEAPQRM
ncbi:MAG: arginine--tRNA ligase [Lachnospiraceae bacterium]|nr:arginine--tRNA ligase [Lachnospiraceae bacterium]